MDRDIAPPTASRITLTSASPPAFVLDTYGNAEGGVRSPFVDLPLYTYCPADTTVASSGPLGFLYCTLFGYKVPLSETQLTHLYNSHNQYFGEVQQEVGQMAREGFLLPSSARTIISQAQGADAP